MLRPVVLALAVFLGAAAPAAAQPATQPAEAFRRDAAAANAFEIETSRLALSRSSNPRIRGFARRIIREEAAVSRALGGRAGPEADPRRAAMTAELAGLRGRAFDLAYARQQVAVLGEAVQLYTLYARAGADPELRSFARTALPRLQQQLAFARRLADTAPR